MTPVVHQRVTAPSASNKKWIHIDDFTQNTDAFLPYSQGWKMTVQDTLKQNPTELKIKVVKKFTVADKTYSVSWNKKKWPVISHNQEIIRILLVFRTVQGCYLFGKRYHVSLVDCEHFDRKLATELDNSTASSYRLWNLQETSIVSPVFMIPADCFLNTWYKSSISPFKYS